MIVKGHFAPARATILAAAIGVSCICATVHAARVDIGPFDAVDPVEHQRMIQDAIDNAGPGRHIIVFAPGDYGFTDPGGVRIPGDCTVLLEGARILWSDAVEADGQTFLLKGVANVRFIGGEIVGRRDTWDPGVNVAGIRAMGDCHHIQITDLVCRELTSNAFGFFGTAETPMTEIELLRVRGYNCCNYYGDYLSEQSGPAKGSLREDQGTVAMYHVNDWLVDGCWFEGSHSDGTHFYLSHRGRFVNSVVRGSRMGGYFLEGCEDVIAANNHIDHNGSRGCTIERNSRDCLLVNNIVSSSGREGLWAPDVAGILVQNNIFRTNGRKDDAEKDCEIRLDESEKYEVITRDIRIEGNLFYTTPEQTAAIFLSDGVVDVVVGDNTFHGEARPVYVSEETRKLNVIDVDQ
ncbi:MAG: right-handed parallel beta-helix repeat-containing protein [Candidatus Hydrogenedentes bacterium]|nr:right-handed parallel beta-helix repeat-containing protein [Candidatus Hydrogenedentota bacterium]